MVLNTLENVSLPSYNKCLIEKSQQKNYKSTYSIAVLCGTGALKIIDLLIAVKCIIFMINTITHRNTS